MSLAIVEIMIITVPDIILQRFIVCIVMIAPGMSGIRDKNASTKHSSETTSQDSQLQNHGECHSI